MMVESLMGLGAAFQTAGLQPSDVLKEIIKQRSQGLIII